jgi:hypothetical protein
MGTPLTGSTVASTYTGLLKTSDNSALTGTLKSVSDGSGNDSALQLSNSAASISGTLTATGATTLQSTLGVTGVTTLQSTLGVTGAATLQSTLLLSGAATLQSTLGVTGATNLSTLSTSGNATVGGNLNVTGATTLSGNLSVPGTLSCTGDFAVNTNKFNVTASSGNTTTAGTLGVAGDLAVATNKFNVTAASGNTTVAGTLGVTGATSLSSLSTSNAATVGTTLGVTGNTTLSADLTVNGNTTIGDTSGDSLTVTAGTVAINNLPSKSTPIDADTVLLRDSAASNALKTATVSSINKVKFVYSEGFAKTGGSGQTITVTTPGTGYVIQLAGSTSDWTYTWNTTVGNKAIIRVSVPIQTTTPTPVDGPVYIGVAKDSASPTATDYIGVGGAYLTAAQNSPVNVIADMVFTATATSHTFRIFVTGAAQTLFIARNTTGYYFGQTGATLQAKVQFDLLEYA